MRQIGLKWMEGYLENNLYINEAETKSKFDIPHTKSK